MNLTTTLTRTLILLGLSTILSIPAYSQTLAIASGCVGYRNQNQILSVVFDTTSKRAIFYTANLKDQYDYATWVSSEITGPLRFEDRQNPLQVTSTKDQAKRHAIFSSKGSISISSSVGTIVYHCQAYFPGQLGMGH